MNWLAFSLVVAVAAPGLAQGEPDLPAPPMVPAEVPPPQPPPQPPAQPQPGVLQPPTIANQRLPELDEQPPEPAPPPSATTQAGKTASREIRIAMSLLFGAGVGVAGATTGGYLGASSIRPEATPLGAVWTGAAIGWAIAVPVGVVLAGWIFDGDGKLWAAVAGDLLGVLLGAVAVAFSGGAEAAPLLFALPLAGAVIGYEATSAASRSVRPVVSVGPRGSFVGVAGVF